MPNLLDEVKVMAICATNPQTVTTDAPLAKVADKMLRVKIHSITVVDENRKPKGMVSTMDLVKTTFMGGDKAKDIVVSKLIENQKLLFIMEEMSVRDALNLMVEKNVRSLPITDFEEKLLGIITMSDIMRFVKEKM